MARTIEFFNADGDSVTLNDNATYFMRSIRGLAVGDYKFIEDEIPFEPGTRRQFTKTPPRAVDWVGEILSTSALGLEAILENLNGTMLRSEDDQGDGKLRVTRHDGSVRELTCRYWRGLDKAKYGGGGALLRTTLSFRAFDPYFYAATPISDTFTAGTPGTFFPFFPLTLSSSTVFANVTINNPGHVEAWPVWTVTGPGKDIILRNRTSGKYFSLPITLGVGEYMVIDTRPGEKTVEDNTGADRFGDLDLSVSSLWALLAGNNVVRIEMSDTGAGSSVAYSCYPRYKGA